MSYSFKYITLDHNTSDNVNFDSTVTDVWTAIEGFEASYGEDTDHHIQGIQVETDGKISEEDPTVVNVSALCRHYDKNSHVAEGSISILVIAQLSSE